MDDIYKTQEKFHYFSNENNVNREEIESHHVHTEGEGAGSGLAYRKKCSVNLLESLRRRNWE